MNQPIAIVQEEWLRVLGKGMITLPIRWRKDMGITPGKVVKAKKIGNKVVIENEALYAPIRSYTDEEIDQFVKDDQLSPKLAAKIDAKIAKRRQN